MKKSYIEKINKMGKIGLAVAKICSVMVSIAMVCCIVAGCLLAFVPQNGITVTTSHRTQIDMDMTHSIMPKLVGIEADSDGSFELDGIKYDQFEITGTLSSQTAVAKSTPYTYSLRDIMWVAFTGAAACAAFIYLLKKVTALFSLFTGCETPFTSEIADGIKKLAVSFIPAIIMTWVTEAVTGLVTTGVFDLVIGIDLTMVMIIVVVLIMSEIFRYGAMLQQESDETL